MTDSPPDYARLGAAEAKMRRALGLYGHTQIQSTPVHSTTPPNQSHPQMRRFVPDGEVPVTVIHLDHRPDELSGVNQLEATRQAIRTEVGARERAERLLANAQATIRDLQTNLTHERLARDEAVQRADAEKQASEQALQSVQAELAAKRSARQKAEAIGRAAAEARDVAVPGNQDGSAASAVRRPVGRPRKTAAAKLGQAPTKLRPSGKRTPAVADELEDHRKPDLPAMPHASKPIEWWLQGR